MKIKNIDEILTDDGFLAWYFKKEGADYALWDNLLKNDPEQKKTIESAILILEKIKIKEEKNHLQKTEAAEAKLFEAINVNKTANAPSPVISITAKTKLRWWIAAAVFLGVGVFSFLKFAESSKQGLETNYAEVKSSSLPDGSVVTLNANSSLTYGKVWQGANDREVWVNGEAYFDVKKTQQKSRFIVHANSYDIIVTGTQFNVVNRAGKINVLLKEGGVIIRNSNGSNIAMKPGDFIQVENNRLIKKKAKDTQVLAWKDRKFIFEKTPMKEVGASIKELYGYDVTFGDAASAADSISGILPNENLDIFLQSLEAAQNYSIVKANKAILISTRR